MKTFLSGKIHGIRVTSKSLDYHGSVSIGPELLEAAGIQSYEQVALVNLNNGERWETYAIPGDTGDLCLNGGGARLGEIGDPCIVLSYTHAAEFAGASVIFVDAKNAITGEMRYS